jgi:hypothetical protein
LRRPVIAWVPVVFCLVFFGITCWWLSRDRSIPVYDAGFHLTFAIHVEEAVASGHLGRAFTLSSPYPPLAYLVGALGIFVGGLGVAPPIIALNVIFVTLLALGCYKVASLAFGPRAGALAAIFALGSPLIIEEFHEFMLDAPEAAMVAVSVWAILATERFSRLRVCAMAGVVVGLGLLSKETFVFFVSGVVVVALLRGGRQAWRGFMLFSIIALVIAGPWYVHQIPALRTLGHEAFASSGASVTQIGFAGTAPPRLSMANLEWYFWSLVNWQLYIPLLAFATIGAAWTLAGFVRKRSVSPVAPELAGGAFVSWAALTETYVHDFRYGIPLLVYLAVFGAGWVGRLPRAAFCVLASVLILIVAANTLGISFGRGSIIATRSPREGVGEQFAGTFTFFKNEGAWMDKPIRDGNLLGLLRALRREGVQEVRWYSEQEIEINFSSPGITALAQIAGLRVPGSPVDPDRADRRRAFLHDQPLYAGATPCIRLWDGTGVWVRLGGPAAPGAWNHCPPHPA